jgi:succinate dehydrogenase / fumarate reductase, iron-sulfur subunit
MKVKLRVKRSDPSKGDGGYSRYEIDTSESTTLLDALIQVREYEDGTLALRCSCRSAICGSCSMRVDGRARLACRAKVIALTGGNESHEITVEPMGNMPVIKDLVTDMELFWSKVREVDPYIQPAGPPPDGEYRVPNEAMIDLTHTMNCIMCGACVSDCTVLEIDKNFIAPAALAKAYRVVADPRDDKTHDRLVELSEYGGVWDCTRCNMCVEVCPKGVAPMNRILQLREMAIEHGIKNNAGVRHTNIFTKSIEDGGRLNEVWMVPGSVGIFNVPRMMKETIGALRMLRVGKLPLGQAIPPGFPGSHKMRGMDRVRNVIRKSASLKPRKAEVKD